MDKEPGNPRDESIDRAAKLAADLFVYAPVGLARQLTKSLPDLIKSGREVLETPLTAAKVMGKYSVDQQRRDLDQHGKDLANKARQAAESFFGSTTKSATGAAASTETPAAAEETAQASEAWASDRGQAPFHSSPSQPPTDLPIEGYATLSASQILGHLEFLDSAQLDAVEAYEASTRNRKSVLARIALLRAAL